MATITALGIGSGIDVRGLVDQLVAAEREGPETRLIQREAQLQAELTAFGSLRSALSTLDTALQRLGDLDAGRTAVSGDLDAFTATADTSADLGSYQIDIGNLARAQTLATDAFDAEDAVVGTGTLSVTVGAGEAVEITIDETNNTLTGVRDALNESGIAANAVVVNDGAGYRLLLTSDQTGLENSIDIAVTDGDGSLVDGTGLSQLSYTGGAQVMSEPTSALDASVTINGLSISSADNVLEDAIPGVTLTLKDRTDAPVSLDVNADESAVSGALNAFVSAYNEVQSLIRSQTAFNVDTGEGSVLTGDSTARGLSTRLTAALTQTYGAATETFNNLVQLGLSTNDDGNLELDSDTLDEALTGNFASVVSLAASAGDALRDTALGYLGDEGLLQVRTDGIETRLDDITDERARLDLRIEAIEARFVRQFSALDILVAELQSTGEFLQSQLASLPEPLAFRNN
jgi:flagellar hook-associated protein 2